MRKKLPMLKVLAACTLLYFGLPTLVMAACTNATPCEWTLYAKPSTSELHLQYGDTLKLQFKGNQTRLFPSAANWESGPPTGIPLQMTVVYDPAGDPTDPQKGWIIPAWEFKFKSKNATTPPGNEHVKALLYQDPANNEWKLTAEHTDGSIHGGAAHMTD